MYAGGTCPTKPILIIHGEGEYLTAAPNELVYQALDFFKELVPEVKPYDGQPVIMMIAYGPLQYDYASYHEIDGYTCYSRIIHVCRHRIKRLS